MKQINNYAEFYSLLNRLPSTDKEDLKKQIVYQYTNGRTTSLKLIKPSEYREACEGMRKLVPDVGVDMIRKALKQKRSNVLHQMQLIGVDTSNWSKVDAFCKSPKIAGKDFRNLSGDELDSLYKKLRMIRKKKES